MHGHQPRDRGCARCCEAFTEKVLERARALKVGPGIEPETWMGPQVSADQQRTVLEYIEIGKREGAELLLGGGVPAGERYAHGHYVEPTVFATCGPACGSRRRRSSARCWGSSRRRAATEALGLANDVQFGLSASICTRNMRAAMEFVGTASKRASCM